MIPSHAPFLFYSPAQWQFTCLFFFVKGKAPPYSAYTEWARTPNSTRVLIEQSLAICIANAEPRAGAWQNGMNIPFEGNYIYHNNI